MRNAIYDILKGKLLLEDKANKNWRMLFYLFFLALVMIFSSHRAEKKVHEIALRNTKAKELRAQFVEGRSKLMRLQMESDIQKKLSPFGVKKSKIPPTKIIITQTIE